MGQGRVQALEWLKKCPEVAKEIDTKIREMSIIKPTEEGTETIDVAAPEVAVAEGTEDAGQ
jgi:hypothetical protein